MSSSIFCDPAYDPIFEILKYSLQLIYLLPALIINFYIFYTIQVSHRDNYISQAFHITCSLDCLMSSIHLFLDISMTRLFLFVTPLCPTLSNYFQTTPFFLNFALPLFYYCRSAKISIQLCLALNRLHCVLSPQNYSHFWKKLIRFIYLFVLLTPFAIIWNLILSDPTVVFVYGGFLMTIVRRIPWASLSTLQLIWMSFTTTITTLIIPIILRRLYQINNKICNFDQSLCLYSCLTSGIFLIATILQAILTFSVFTSPLVSWLKYLTWDLINVSSPIILMIVCQQLRRQVFKSQTNSHAFIFIEPSDI